MSSAQKNYSTTERQCLGVVWSVLHVRPYLSHTHFTVRTDHNALRWAFFIAEAEGRLAKWRLRLAEFDFDVVYRPGIKHTVPEALSRVPTQGGDQSYQEDEIPCFVVVGEDGEPDWGTAFDDFPDGSDPDVSLLVHPKGDLEPIRIEEWLRVQKRRRLLLIRQEKHRGK